MRDIRFRVFDIRDEKYIENYHCWIDDGELNSSFLYADSEDIIFEQFLGMYDNTKWEETTEEEREKWRRGHGTTVDKWKGKPIYEGDVLFIEIKSTCGYESKYQWICPPITESFHGYQELQQIIEKDGYDVSIVKVVGNVHKY